MEACRNLSVVECSLGSDHSRQALAIHGSYVHFRYQLDSFEAVLVRAGEPQDAPDLGS